MPEISFQSRAKGVSSLTGSVPVEPVLRAFSPAGEVVPASHTLPRETRTLGDPEAETLGIGIDVGQMLFSDITEQVFRIDKMVAIVHVTVVFYHKTVTTGLTH